MGILAMFMDAGPQGGPAVQSLAGSLCYLSVGIDKHKGDSHNRGESEN